MYAFISTPLPQPTYDVVGASVVLVLVHAALSSSPVNQHRTVDEELGLVMEEVTVS